MYSRCNPYTVCMLGQLAFHEEICVPMSFWFHSCLEKLTELMCLVEENPTLEYSVLIEDSEENFKVRFVKNMYTVYRFDIL